MFQFSEIDIYCIIMSTICTLYLIFPVSNGIKSYYSLLCFRFNQIDMKNILKLSYENKSTL